MNSMKSRVNQNIFYQYEGNCPPHPLWSLEAQGSVSGESFGEWLLLGRRLCRVSPLDWLVCRGAEFGSLECFYLAYVVWSWLFPELGKEMATHSSILALKIPWTEDPGRLQSMGSQRVGHDWATSIWKERALETKQELPFAKTCFQS